MAALKISDLSVGDWVRYRDREWQVCSIYQFTGEVGLFRNRIKFLNNGIVNNKITFSSSFYCYDILPKQIIMINK